MKHISIDSETWGKRAGFDIRSIGACLFDPYNFDKSFSQENSFYKALDNPLMGTYSHDHYTQFDLDCLGGLNRKYYLKRDIETVKFWNDQSDEAKAAFENPIDLKEGLILLSDFILSHSEDIKYGQARDICLWSHGSAFDPPIIEYAYHVCRMEVPWFYRANRDTRTLFDDAQVGDHSEWLKSHNLGTLHHAGWDALSQAYAISSAKMRLKKVFDSYELSSV